MHSSSLTPCSFVPIGAAIIERLTVDCKECLVQQDTFLAIRQHSVFYYYYFYTEVVLIMQHLNACTVIGDHITATFCNWVLREMDVHNYVMEMAGFTGT